MTSSILRVSRDPHLRGPSLRGVRLRGPSLRGVRLRAPSRPNLHGAHLRGPNVRGVRLRGPNLRGARLHGPSHLRDASLLKGTEKMVTETSYQTCNRCPNDTTTGRCCTD